MDKQKFVAHRIGELMLNAWLVEADLAAERERRRSEIEELQGLRARVGALAEDGHDDAVAR